jgi:glyoxylase-like metal-dependent hydrolase (beta-lactamase superfamily II)
MYCFTEGYFSNVYLIKRFDQIIIVDPSCCYSEIIKYVGTNKIIGIILTHAHFDHISQLHCYLDYPIYIHKADEELLFDDSKNGGISYNHSLNLKKYNLKLNYIDNDSTIDIGDTKISILETPGHTKGSICIKYQNVLYTGDTLFKGDVGRTDLYGGSSFLLKKSLSTIISSNSNSTIIYPGHGDKTDLKTEKNTNNFITRYLQNER